MMPCKPPLPHLTEELSARIHPRFICLLSLLLSTDLMSRMRGPEKRSISSCCLPNAEYCTIGPKALGVRRDLSKQDRMMGWDTREPYLYIVTGHEGEGRLSMRETQNGRRLADWNIHVTWRGEKRDRPLHKLS